jgi:hypothetical protein
MAAFNERSPYTIQQQEPVARSPGGPQAKTGQGIRKPQLFLFDLFIVFVVTL